MLTQIRHSILKGSFLVSRHADVEMAEDKLTLKEVLDTVLRGEIVEMYPKDFPFPSCLIYGMIKGEEVVHSVWAYDETKKLAILITVYRPDVGRWINFKIRR